MSTVAGYAFGFLALLCAFLGLVSLVRYSDQGALTRKGIAVSAGFLAAMAVSLIAMLIVEGVDLLVNLFGLALIIASVAFYWVASLINLKIGEKLADNGLAGTIRDLLRSIRGR